MTQHLDLSADALAGRRLVIDGVDFRVAPLGGFSMDDNLVIVKPMSAVEAYRDLLGQYTRPRMIELGIAHGGSASGSMRSSPTPPGWSPWSWPPIVCPFSTGSSPTDICKTG